MDRRSFFGLAAGALSLTRMTPAAGANLEGKKGLRLSITWGMLGRMPVPEAMALLNRLGYDAYEMFDWRSPGLLETFVAEKNHSPLFCACLVANKGVTAPGCGLVNPREREGFLRELEASIEPAKKMDCRQLVVLVYAILVSLVNIRNPASPRVPAVVTLMSALECLRPITGLRDRWSAGRREIRSMPMKMNSQSTEQDRMESLGSMMAGLPEGHDSFRGLPCRCVSHRRACAGGPRTEGSALRCPSLEQPPS